MMNNCIQHPGRKADSPTSIGSFCAQCAEQIKSAQESVRRHVEPKKCFVIYKGSSSGWETFQGTGCAHWVAHQLQIKRGYQSDRCAEGFSIKVPDVIAGARKIDRAGEDVKVGDIWRGHVPFDHCGLVIRVEESSEEGGQKITIRHCSSGNEKGVTDSDFATYFKGKGDFYRL